MYTCIWFSLTKMADMNNCIFWRFHLRKHVLRSTLLMFSITILVWSHDLFWLTLQVFHPDEIKARMAAGDPELDGFDLVVDCTGSARAAEMAFTWLKRGATYNIFGVYIRKIHMSLEPPSCESQAMLDSLWWESSSVWLSSHRDS